MPNEVWLIHTSDLLANNSVFHYKNGNILIIPSIFPSNFSMSKWRQTNGICATYRWQHTEPVTSADMCSWRESGTHWSWTTLVTVLILHTERKQSRLLRSRQRNAMVKNQSNNSAWLWRRRKNYYPSKRLEILTQRHSSIYQKIWVFSNTAFRTPNLPRKKDIGRLRKALDVEEETIRSLRNHDTTQSLMFFIPCIIV